MAKKRTPNQLRIIGGEWRGRKLRFVDAEGLRPTLDRVRETLFNWLQFDIPNAVCLDLFTGSGALAFESLSRGAQHVTMVDAYAPTIQQIKKNLKELDCDKAVLIQQKALQYLQHTPKNPFDIVFLDPPFYKNYVFDVCDLLVKNQFLHADSLIYIEVENQFDINDLEQSWTQLKSKTSGQTSYYLYKTK